MDLLFGLGYVADEIVADNGGEFLNKWVDAVLEKWNVRMIHSRPHHPETNGTIERSNRVFKERLRALCHENPTMPWWELMQLASCE